MHDDSFQTEIKLEVFYVVSQFNYNFNVKHLHLLINLNKLCTALQQIASQIRA